MKTWIIQLLGIIVHFMFLISINDIQRNTEKFRGYWINCTSQAISKRLVLIVTDGIDKENLSNVNNSPFLQKIKTSGIWGTANRDKLTEASGITAMTSGFEEQSEIFPNIYKYNQGEYDNVFNYASKVYYFGDKPTLSHFNKGSQGWSKFVSSHDSGESVHHMMKNAFRNESSNRVGNLMIFVHLSKNELLKANKGKGMIDALDRVIQNVAHIINQVFDDNETTYIFCSNKIEVNKNDKSNVLFYLWGHKVKPISKVKVNMTDICPIISGILGNPNPLSSIGKWQTGFFKISEEEEAKAKACNALHLASIATSIQQQVGNKALKSIGLSHSNDDKTLEDYQKTLFRLMAKNNNFKGISETSNALASHSLHIIKKDIIFIQRVIYSLTHITYIGWSLLLLTKIVALSISRDAALKHEIKILRRKTELWFFGLHIILLLLGGMSILFVIIQGWPIYYIIYSLPALLIWGSVLNNIQTWIGFINKLHKRKSIIILLYTVLYGMIVEAHYWGLSYNTVLAVHIAVISLFNIGVSFINKEYIGIKISITSAAVFIIGSVFIPLNNMKMSPQILIACGLTWVIAGILSTFYMWISREIVDSIVMLASLIHYCMSFVITIICIYNKNQASPIMFIVLLVIGNFLPILGKAIIPAAEVPLNVDRYRKSNRIHQVSVCTSSILLLFSVAYEPLFALLVYTYSLMWIFITEPKIKMESMNYENAHYVATFTMLIIAIQHFLGLSEPSRESMYIIKYSLPPIDIIIQILDQIKIYLPVFIVQFMFTSLTLSSGGDSQMHLAFLIQNLCGYRLFMGMEELSKNDSTDKKVLAHTSLHAVLMFQFFTQQLVQVLLHASVLKLYNYFRSMLLELRNLMNR